MEYNWQFTSAGGGTGVNWSTNYRTVETIEPPLFSRLNRCLCRLQFRLVTNSTKLTKNECGGLVTYGVTGGATWRRAGLKIGVYFITNGHESPELAMRRVRAGIGASIVYEIPMGKGQKKLAEKISKAVYRKYSAMFGRITSIKEISVPRQTRGGRGGWKQKTAHSVFRLSDLDGG
jgi:hypothetical protein